MKKIAIILLTIIVLTSFVSATLQLSPGKIYFDLSPNERECQEITISSEDYEGEINIRDAWSKDLNEINGNKYTFSAEDCKISIDYDNYLKDLNNPKDVEVCIEGKDNVNCRGIIIFTPESETNVVVEVGAWLFVNIVELQELTTNNDAGSSGGGGGSGGGAGTPAQSTAQPEQTQENTETNQEQEQQTSGITGAVVGTEKLRDWKIILNILVIISIVSLLVHYRNKKLKSEGRI